MLSPAQALSSSLCSATSGYTDEKSVLASKQKITICHFEAWKHLGRWVTRRAAEFCTPFCFQTSLKQSHVDCDNQSMRQNNRILFKESYKNVPKSLISWSNAEVFHLSITPNNGIYKPFQRLALAPVISQTARTSSQWLFFPLCLSVSSSHSSPFSVTPQSWVAPIHPISFSSSNDRKTVTGLKMTSREVTRVTSIPKPPTSTSLPNGPLHRLRETDDGRSWWEASDFGVKTNRKSNFFFHQVLLGKGK